MRLRHLALCALVAALPACGGEPTSPIQPPGEPSLLAGTRSSLYNGQIPTEVLDATGGWEVGTRFTTSKPGRVIGFRFYRAPGESGSNYGRLWSSSGQRLKQSVPFPSGTGWVTVMLGTPVPLTPGEVYRVSVNTNYKQVKTPGGYVHEGPLSGGPLYSDGGYYGQPTGAMPTSSSASYFFVDVIFEEDVPPPPQPDLWVRQVWPYDGQNVRVTICNAGNADSPPFNARMWHWVAPLPSGPGWWKTATDGLAFPAITAGTCEVRSYPSAAMYYYRNEFHVRADIGGTVAESNENNNLKIEVWEWTL